MNGLYIEKVSDRLLIRTGIALWHSTHVPPAGWRFAFVLRRGLRIIGVSTFGRPVARMEDSTHTLEHTRMALCPTVPKNSASWFMAATRRWLRANAPQFTRLISYVDETHHSGVTYRADNWQTVYKDQRSVKTWFNRPGRVQRECARRTKFERSP